MNKLICLHCGSGRVHRSQRKGWIDRAVLLVGGRTCRCHECNARFARFGGSLMRVTDLNRAARRFLLALAMMSAAGAILASIVWFSHKMVLSPTDSTMNSPTPFSAKAVRGS